MALWRAILGRESLCPDLHFDAILPMRIRWQYLTSTLPAVALCKYL
jgi:hypothetical protein